ncbi:MAG TPA: hypothetical protein VGL65_12395 [Gemmatimonadales bacterium]|jgi:hypothetical protein
MVVLTNGAVWRIYKVYFEKPIDRELIADITIADVNARRPADLETLWLLSKEAWQRSRLDEYAARREALSRFTIAAILLSEPALGIVRRELRRVSPDAVVTIEQIADVLTGEVMKRDVLDGEKAAAAKRMVARCRTRALRDTGERPAVGTGQAVGAHT